MPGFRRCESIQTLHIAVRHDDLVHTLVVVYYEYHTSTSMMLNAALIAMEHDEKQSMPNVVSAICGAHAHSQNFWNQTTVDYSAQCTVHSAQYTVLEGTR